MAAVISYYFEHAQHVGMPAVAGFDYRLCTHGGREQGAAHAPNPPGVGGGDSVAKEGQVARCQTKTKAQTQTRRIDCIDKFSFN